MGNALNEDGEAVDDDAALEVDEAEAVEVEPSPV